MENAQRKREILDVCLATFIRRGLYETSVRDLSRALALQSGGIYYWFKDKDDVVIKVTTAKKKVGKGEDGGDTPSAS